VPRPRRRPRADAPAGTRRGRRRRPPTRVRVSTVQLLWQRRPDSAGARAATAAATGSPATLPRRPSSGGRIMAVRLFEHDPGQLDPDRMASFRKILRRWKLDRVAGEEQARGRVALRRRATETAPGPRGGRRRSGRTPPGPGRTGRASSRSSVSPGWSSRGAACPDRTVSAGGSGFRRSAIPCARDPARPRPVWLSGMGRRPRADTELVRELTGRRESLV
jgi:hypothetical protein